MSTANTNPTPEEQMFLTDGIGRAAILVAALLVPIGVLLMTGAGGLLSPVAFFLLPSLAVAILAAWLAKPGLVFVSALITTIVPAAFLMPTAAAIFANPLATGEFVGALLATLGPVVALATGARAMAQRTRRLDDGPLATILSVAVIAALLGAGVTSALAGARAVATGAGGGYDIEPDVTLALSTKDFEFAPEVIRVPAGRIVEFRVTNEDPALHTFTYAMNGRTYEHDLLPGATTSFIARFAKTGEIELWCRPHIERDEGGHRQGMVAKLVVE